MKTKKIGTVVLFIVFAIGLAAINAILGFCLGFMVGCLMNFLFGPVIIGGLTAFGFTVEAYQVPYMFAVLFTIMPFITDQKLLKIDLKFENDGLTGWKI